MSPGKQLATVCSHPYLWLEWVSAGKSRLLGVTIMNAGESRRKPGRLRLGELLKAHKRSLALGLLAVAGEGAANLLEPWPLKIVLDSVLRARDNHPAVGHWVHALVGSD